MSAVDLDDPEAFAEADPDDALGVTLDAPNRWEQGAALAEGAALPGEPAAVLVAGMGGSGIAGDVAAALAAERLSYPVVPHKDADLPAWVGPRVPVVAVSHSGTTEETLAVARAAVAAGAPLVAITAGGPLAKLAAESGGQVLAVPAGGQPRHALGHLAGALCALLGAADDVPAAVAAQRAVVTALGPHVPSEANPAKQLAAAIAEVDTVEVWATSAPSHVAALRLACQLEEQAKLPAGVAALPELAHNEVVGWQEGVAGATRRGLVVLRDPASETAAAADRLAPALAIVEGSFGFVARRAVDAPGDPMLARLAALCLAADLVSVYAALARGVDPTPIASIDRLKAAVAEARAQEDR